MPREPKYQPLTGAESDHSSIDDTAHEAVEMSSPQKASWTIIRRLIFLAGAVAGGLITYLSLSFVDYSSSSHSPADASHVPQFAPEMPTVTTTFYKKQVLMDEPNAENQLVWDSLVPIGRGFVNISNPQDFGLLPGIPTEEGVDRYSVAMYHQLHCLDALRHQYWRLIRAMSTPMSDDVRQETVHKMLRDNHAQHCFAYIAESIMCSGDLTIEWAKVEGDGTRKQVDGWGVPHKCKDPEAIRAWMEANHGPVRTGHNHE
ncbi:hypothetical protein F5Y10DRAFT_288927 [Nemania abortiva]|nr:hypothetical protein F5Y10DRAFT_288927 [Nemania abortiva]